MVIALNTLHQNFNTIMVSFLKTKNKTIDKIQSILQSKKAKNISKHAIKVTKNLVMAFKDRNNTNFFEEKVNSNKKYFNYYKLGYFGKNSSHFNKKFQQSNLILCLCNNF